MPWTARVPIAASRESRRGDGSLPAWLRQRGDGSDLDARDGSHRGRCDGRPSTTRGPVRPGGPYSDERRGAQGRASGGQGLRPYDPGVASGGQGYPPWNPGASGMAGQAWACPRRAPKATRPCPGAPGRSSGRALHLARPGTARSGRACTTGWPDTRTGRTSVKDSLTPNRRTVAPGTGTCRRTYRVPREAETVQRNEREPTYEMTASSPSWCHSSTQSSSSM